MTKQRAIPLQEAYPNIPFREKRRLWERLPGMKPECIHLDSDSSWSACFSPDTHVVKARWTETHGTRFRPDVCLCKPCLLSVLQPELPSYLGRVIAFEPPLDDAQQYFFAAEADFMDAGMAEATAHAISKRLGNLSGPCIHCARQATWLWLGRSDVLDVDDPEGIADATGTPMCREHGAKFLCSLVGNSTKADLEYVNMPYGNSGAYVWA